MSLGKYRWVIFIVLTVLAYFGVLQSFNWYAFISLVLAIWTMP